VFLVGRSLFFLLVRSEKYTPRFQVLTQAKLFACSLRILLRKIRPAGLDPESRLFYFASLIKQTRVLGRPLFIFPPCEVGKIYSAVSSPDASKIVCLLFAYFTS